MSQSHLDGTLVVAQLKRSLLGGAVYTDVTVRDCKGGLKKLGTLTVLDDIRHAMVPGSRGRFYHYNMLGSKGVHGFRPVCGKAHGHFPYRWELMGWGLGLLNLMLVLIRLLTEGKIALWSVGFGLLGLVLGVIFSATRIAADKAYRADDAVMPSKAQLKAAGLRA
jgi:hypothetical protein